ncbi:MAG: hypothetical protein HQ549_05215 [Candidatus Omnitrophica bacterium]|nr:hypothetical protein [Candidatus Omnitrophota bacterium]
MTIYRAKCNIIGVFASLVVVFAVLVPCICNADEDIEDIFASVVVLPVFDINIDNNYINFGVVNPGDSVTLKEGTYYNTIKCAANKGRKYYVKIHILNEVIGPKGNQIPPESFKWRIYHTDGRGIAAPGWQEFSDEPQVVYTSDTEDEIGKELILRFQYKLDLPGSAMGGHYGLKVAYLITETE